MYAVVKTLLQEQQKRDAPIPFRPNHGMKMLSDFERPARLHHHRPPQGPR